jgi:uncharacterized protein YoxC
MKTGLMFGAACLIAAAEVIPPEMLDPVSRMSVTGALLFLVIWLVTKQDRKTGEGLKDVAKAVEKMADATNELRTHCAAVRSKE